MLSTVFNPPFTFVSARHEEKQPWRETADQELSNEEVPSFQNNARKLGGRNAPCVESRQREKPHSSLTGTSEAPYGSNGRTEKARQKPEHEKNRWAVNNTPTVGARCAPTLGESRSTRTHTLVRATRALTSAHARVQTRTGAVDEGT